MEQDSENDINVALQEAEKRIAELTKINTVLKANISTLYRTAKAEIQRKNDRISELQSELDDLIFRRNGRRCESTKQTVEQNKN